MESSLVLVWKVKKYSSDEGCCDTLALKKMKIWDIGNGISDSCTCRTQEEAVNIEGEKGLLDGRVFSSDPAAMPKTYESKKSKASCVLLQIFNPIRSSTYVGVGEVSFFGLIPNLFSSPYHFSDSFKATNFILGTHGLKYSMVVSMIFLCLL